MNKTTDIITLLCVTLWSTGQFCVWIASKYDDTFDTNFNNKNEQCSDKESWPHKIEPTGYNFSTANAMCQQYFGSDLAAIHSNDDLNDVYNAILTGDDNYNQTWIGLTRIPVNMSVNYNYNGNINKLVSWQAESGSQ